MTKKKLNKEVKFLRKLVQDQSEQIILLMKQLPNYTQTITIPSVFTSPCQHEYPNPWMATVPPNCKKCGQQADIYSVTYATGNVDSTMTAKLVPGTFTT